MRIKDLYSDNPLVRVERKKVREFKRRFDEENIPDSAMLIQFGDEVEVEVIADSQSAPDVENWVGSPFGKFLEWMWEIIQIRREEYK